MTPTQNDKLLPYILNEKNKPITKKYIHAVLKRYNVDIQIKTLEYFQKAMVHVSYLIRDKRFYSNNKTKPYRLQSTEIEPLDDKYITTVMPLQKDSFERLEFLGDAQVHAILADYIFYRYPDQDEGFMTKLRTKIENGDSMTVLSKTMGLDEYGIISRHMELNDSRENNSSLLEDIFEAFIGALYLCAGFKKCKRFIFSLIEKEIDFAQLLNTETNFKEKLLQFFHMQKWRDPIYGQLDVSGPEKKKLYTMYVKCKKTPQDEGTIVGVGVSTSKKGGEQQSAANALEEFGVLRNDDSDVEEYEELSDS